jgi:aspartate-semialdehyde dehydrogenase
MVENIDIAVVGATDAVGEAIISLLEAREVPVGTLFPLVEQDAAGHKVEFKGKYLTAQTLEEFDFSRVNIALFAVDAPLAQEYVPKAAAAGCVAIDFSGCFAGEEDVPLVVPEVNPLAIGQGCERGIIASPGSVSVMLWVALKPLHDAVGISRLNLVSLQAVSGDGKAAVDELAAQTVALLNMRQVQNAIYPKQIAFNILPQINGLEDNGYSREEMKLLWESQKLLSDSAMVINATAVTVPVFHGHSLIVHLETETKMTALQARDLLQRTPGVAVMDSPELGDYPTAVTEAAGNDKVFVGRIREDISHPGGLDIWIVADNIRRGMALNGVQIVEILVKDYL